VDLPDPPAPDRQVRVEQARGAGRETFCEAIRPATVGPVRMEVVADSLGLAVTDRDEPAVRAAQRAASLGSTDRVVPQRSISETRESCIRSLSCWSRLLSTAPVERSRRFATWSGSRLMS